MSEKKIDLYNYEDRYKRRYELFEKSNIRERNKEIIRRILLQLQIEGLSWNRQFKYLINLQKIDSMFNEEFEKATEDSITRLIIKINMCKPNMKQIYQITLKRIYKFLRRKDITDLIKIKHVKSNITPDQLLTAEEVRKLVENADTEKNALMLSLLYETGMRPGELIKWNRKAIFDNIGAIIVVCDKTGPRPIRIVRNAGRLKEYLENHNEEYPFLMSIELFEKMFRKLREKSGIRKRIWPYLFRHTAATRDYGKVSDLALKRRFGWAANSRMPDTVYVHLSNENIDSEILNNLYGIKVPDRISPI